MKKQAYVFLFIVASFALFGGCQKSNEISDAIQINNLFAIKPDNSNPVAEKRYEIYEKHGVPVFFNDTIGRNYIGQSLSGDSLYVYETLDLPWRFTARAGEFSFVYEEDQERQLQSLLFIDSYLAKASKPLRPFSILVVDKLTTTEESTTVPYTDVETGARKSLLFYNAARTLVFAGVGDKNAGAADEVADLVIKTLIKDRILNISDQLTDFYTVSDKDHYNKMWNRLNAGIAGSFSTGLLSETTARNYVNNLGWTWERVEEQRQIIRATIGQFGFVGGTPGLTYYSPRNSTQDLQLFVEEMLKYPRAQFEAYWGNQPLVMRKYDIIYNAIVAELDYRL